MLALEQQLRSIHRFGHLDLSEGGLWHRNGAPAVRAFRADPTIAWGDRTCAGTEHELATDRVSGHLCGSVSTHQLSAESTLRSSNGRSESNRRICVGGQLSTVSESDAAGARNRVGSARCLVAPGRRCGTAQSRRAGSRSFAMVTLVAHVQRGLYVPCEHLLSVLVAVVSEEVHQYVVGRIVSTNQEIIAFD